MKPTLFLDLDFVLIQHDEEKFLTFCENNGCEVALNVFRKTHSFVQSIHRPGHTGPQYLDELLLRFMQTKEYKPVAIPGAANAVKKLSQRYRIDIATARGRWSRRTTEATLCKCFPSLQPSQVHMHLHHRKGEMLNRFPGSALVDDSHEEINFAAHTAPKAHIIHFPSVRRGNDLKRPPVIESANVTRLMACDHLHRVYRNEDKEHLWEAAWAEATHLLLQRSLADIA